MIKFGNKERAANTIKELWGKSEKWKDDETMSRGLDLFLAIIKGDTADNMSVLLKSRRKKDRELVADIHAEVERYSRLNAGKSPGIDRHIVEMQAFTGYEENKTR